MTPSTARVRFEIVRGTFSSWNGLFEEAANIATQLGSDRVISISHSSEHGEGVVTVWYWDTNGEEPATENIAHE